jgi:hypothetical protein
MFSPIVPPHLPYLAGEVVMKNTPVAKKVVIKNAHALFSSPLRRQYVCQTNTKI